MKHIKRSNFKRIQDIFKYLLKNPSSIQSDFKTHSNCIKKILGNLQDNNIIYREPYFLVKKKHHGKIHYNFNHHCLSTIEVFLECQEIKQN